MVVGVSSSSNGSKRSRKNRNVLNYCIGRDAYQRVDPYIDFIRSYVGDFCTVEDLKSNRISSVDLFLLMMLNLSSQKSDILTLMTHQNVH